MHEQVFYINYAKRTKDKLGKKYGKRWYENIKGLTILPTFILCS